MTQSERILQHMRKHGSITPMEAMQEYGCMRLGARIYDLKKSGHEIATIFESGTNRYGAKVSYARYMLR